MEFEYIEHQTGLPYKLFLVSIGKRLPHFHTDIEIIYVVKGSIILKKNDHSLHLSQGEMVIVNNLEVHQIIDGGSPEWNVLLIIQLSPKAFQHHQHRLTNYRFSFQKCHNDHQLLSDYLIKIYLESFEKHEGSYLLKKGYLSSFLGLLLRDESYVMTDNTPYSSNEETRRIQFVIEYVEKHFSESIRLDTLSSELHISKYHLSHLITSHMGMSFQSYLMNVRFTHALHLLSTSHDRIIDIALKSGFSDVKYLNRQMKNSFGVTASAFREKALSETSRVPQAPIGSYHLPVDEAALHVYLKTHLHASQKSQDCHGV